MKEQKRELVLVEWEDAWGQQGWVSQEAVIKEHGPSQITSVGFVIKKDKKGISLGKGFSANNGILSNEFIPASCIKRIKKVRY